MATKECTGVGGLDDILSGGLPGGRLYLLQGDPGAGKTTLAMQFLLEGINQGEAALYVTLSESKAEILDIAASHRWSLDALNILEISVNDEGRDEDNTLFHPAEVELGERMQIIFAEVDRLQPKRVVLDSCSELRLLAQSPLRFRRQILSLKRRLSERGCTVLLIDNPVDDSGDLLLQSLAHGVVHLEQLTPLFGAARRRLRVTKLRGVAYRGGYHDFTIRQGGLAVYPRLVASEHVDPSSPIEAVSSGIPGLDQLLGGGIERGTATLIMGPAGAGKSALASQWAIAAAKRGERVLIYTFEEPPDILRRRSASLGMDIEGPIARGEIVLTPVDPSEMAPGEFAAAICDDVRKRDARDGDRRQLERLPPRDAGRALLVAPPPRAAQFSPASPGRQHHGRSSTRVHRGRDAVRGRRQLPRRHRASASVLRSDRSGSKGALDRQKAHRASREHHSRVLSRRRRSHRRAAARGLPRRPHRDTRVLRRAPQSRGRRPVTATERKDFDERVLVLAPTGRDAVLTRDVLSRSGFIVLPCGSIDELEERIAEGAGAALLAEETLVPASVTKLARILAAQPAWSDLPIVIFTGAGATIQSMRPTLEMTAPLGNVTLLDRPVRVATLLSAMQSALRGRRRQYAARNVMQEQERAVHARDQFLAMLGHELRNPLSAITLATALIERNNGNAVKQLAILKRQTEHMARLVDDLLDVARVTAGKIVLRKTSVDVAEMARRSVQAHELTARSQSLRLRMIAPPAPVLVEADAVRLEQVITNLLNNAIKYTPPGGEITVEVTAEGERCRLVVADNGTGIAPEVLPTIFDLFSQAERTLDRAQGGLGIGLTLVHRLVELHGGEVTAESAGVGQGARFTIFLPRVESSAASGSAATRSRSLAGRRRVLLVEDMADHREILRELVSSLGHDVEVAEDGLSGFEQALRFHADVMVVDIGLPGIDGYELARRIRAALGSHVRLIAVTGYGQPEDRRRALDAGFDIHLTKPVDIDAMQEAIAASAA
jgi:signal transduction histidine kinase/KaiC/GvpD/RAD55 family RecA-like ATPase/CheY-like chemotaxis protein